MSIEKEIVVRDADGNERTIREVRGQHWAVTGRGRSELVPDALAELHADDGTAVERVEKGAYRIDGVLFTSDDPEAP